MPSSELSYDGIITDVKSIYQRITGTTDDFFDVDLKMKKMNMIEIINQ